MRIWTALLLTFALTLAVTAAEAREGSRIHPDRRADTGLRFNSDRSYMTPGTEFQNDLRGYGRIHPDYTYDYAYPSYGTPWWAVPGDPFANSFSHSRPHYNRGYRYGYRPGISLHYDRGDWNASLYSDWNDPYCRNEPTYYYDNSGYNNAPTYGDGYYDRGISDDQPQVYNDNRVYNYNYGTYPQQQAQPAQQRSVPAPAPKASQAIKPQYSTMGRQFKEELRFSVPDGNYVFAIRKGVLYAGLEDGKAAKLASGVDASFGGYAVWIPGSGVSVIYERGGSLNAAYQLNDGWHLAPLSYKVDTRRETTIGLVGGQPWLVFTATNGTRYVVSFDGRAWNEVGSGTGVR